MSIACIIISHDRRLALLYNEVLPSVVGQGFDEIAVVADSPGPPSKLVRWLVVEPLTQTTIDALVKRDVGTLATRSEILVYLCDDHRLEKHFLWGLRHALDRDDLSWDVLVPSRHCEMPNGTFRALNMGEREGYCGGHAGVFRRHIIVARPWSAHVHHRNWDFLISKEQQAKGARFAYAAIEGVPCWIEDLEPEREPWK